MAADPDRATNRTGDAGSGDAGSGDAGSDTEAPGSQPDADLGARLLAAYRKAAGPAGDERARAAATRRAYAGEARSDPQLLGRQPLGRQPRRRRGWSGPGPDERDPALLARAVDDVVGAQGWQDARVAGRLELRWPEVVGRDVAEHCRLIRLVDGDLLVQAETTAWATQLRLLAPRLLARIREETDGAVRSVRVVGPTAPSWSRGPLRVKGRGPRDTYG